MLIRLHVTKCNSYCIVELTWNGHQETCSAVSLTEGYAGRHSQRIGDCFSLNKQHCCFMIEQRKHSYVLNRTTHNYAHTCNKFHEGGCSFVFRWTCYDRYIRQISKLHKFCYQDICLVILKYFVEAKLVHVIGWAKIHAIPGHKGHSILYPFLVSKCKCKLIGFHIASILIFFSMNWLSAILHHRWQFEWEPCYLWSLFTDRASLRFKSLQWVIVG